MSDSLDFIHRFVPATNGSTRVLLLLHGTGGDESDLLSLGRALDPGAALLSPRGKVLENGAARFFRRFAEGVFDEEDIVRRANELADFIEAASARYGFDPSNLIAAGYSNGANIAAAMMFVRPGSISRAILLRAMVSLAKPPAADLSGRRVFISAGLHDPIIPPENSRRLAAFLQNAGAEVTLETLAADHGLVQEDIAAARRWLAKIS